MREESYIVRIYRRYAKPSTRVEGVLEKAGASRPTPFHSFRELMALLARHAGAGHDKRKRE